MRKTTKIFVVVASVLWLLPVSALAEEITICYKGETLTMSLENTERFFELGAKRGECAGEAKEDSGKDNDAEDDNAGNGDNNANGGGKKSGSGSGKKQKQDKTQKQQKDQQQAGDSSGDGQGKGQGKVMLCHKGKHTIVVSTSAMKAHLAHGDTIGSCSGTQQQGVEQSNNQLDRGDATKGLQKGSGDTEETQSSGGNGGKGKKNKEKKSK